MPFSHRTRRTFESLESRCLLAADLSVEQIGDDLLISGSDLDDRVMITGGAQPGEFNVTHFSFDPNSERPVPAPQELHFEGVFGDIVVKLGRGNDELRVEDAHVLGNLTIDLGDGDDSIAFGGTLGNRQIYAVTSIMLPPRDETPLEVQGDLRIALGAGNDNVDQSSTTVHGNERIETGSGNDDVFLHSLYGNNVIDAALSVNLGEGADLATLSAFHVGGSAIVYDNSGDASIVLGGNVDGSAVIKTGGGNDRIGLYARVQGNLVVSTGVGNDEINQQRGNIAGNEVLLTGPGNDDVSLVPFVLRFDRVHIGGNLSIDLGTGIDHVDIGEIDLDGSLQVRGGGGQKNVSISESRDIAAIQISLAGNSTDDVTLTGVSAGRVSIATQGGDDRLFLDRAVADDNFFASLGDGDDNLFLKTVVAAEPSFIDGGDGVDSVTMTGDAPLTVELRNFEFFWDPGPF